MGGPPMQSDDMGKYGSGKQRISGLGVALKQIFEKIADATEPLVQGIIYFCGWSAILFVLAIFLFVFGQAVLVFDADGISLWRNLSLVEFFTSSSWRPDQHQYGIVALLAGTGAVTVTSTIIAVPFGLGAAVYVSEFCTGRYKECLKVIVELLAAIPSVVWGFIGAVIIHPQIVRTTGAPIGLCVLNAGIILALMSVPVIVSVGEDALKAVPDSYREAALSMGASKWEIIYRVLFPAAKNGLLAAVLLGVGRAIGETMAVLMATGHSVRIPTSLLDPCLTLTATIAAELGEADQSGDHYHVLFVIGVVLFALTFIVNLTADLVVKGIRGKQNA